MSVAVGTPVAVCMPVAVEGPPRSLRAVGHHACGGQAKDSGGGEGVAVGGHDDSGSVRGGLLEQVHDDGRVAFVQR